MQIFWVSGPVGKIHSFNLTIKTVAIAFGALGLFLVVIGAALQFFGFRMALEYDPEIARQLGNLHTAEEMENLNVVYRNRLREIEREQDLIAQQMKEVTAAQKDLVSTLVPVTIKSRANVGALGGVVYSASELTMGDGRSTFASLRAVQKGLLDQKRAISIQAAEILADIDHIDSLPIRVPVRQNPVYVSSGFGNRRDPKTKQQAFHSGIDFELPENTPIHAAGTGTVIQANYESQYGNLVVIRHADGFASRYAHANKLLVREGERVKGGQQIALSGNTGRSTGPHLHFEVVKHGEFVDPAMYVANRPSSSRHF